MLKRWLLDAWLCLPFLAAGVVGTAGAAAAQPDAARAPDGVGYALVIAAALTLATWRRPGLTLVLNGSVVIAYVALGYPYGPVLLTVLPIAYLLAQRWQLTRAALAAAAYLGVLLMASYAKTVREPGGANLSDLLGTALAWGAIMAAVFAVGFAIRARREGAAGVRSEQARRVASEERLRMAGDLHDSIGHGLAVIAMQAGVALHVLERSPQEARAAMEAVRATSREALENLRAELDALRSPESARRRPTFGLADLDRLAERVRAGGVEVLIDMEELPTLPSEVDSAAYRILQESLTNVLRHSGAEATRIRLGCADGVLLLDVTDTGRGGVTGDGSGIRGMRAQAEALGGTLRAGPRPSGGFAVAARLPLGQR